MKTQLLILTCFFALLVARVNAAYIYSLQSGAWNQTSTWSGGSVPSCGDSILISPSHTVSITTQVTYNCSAKTVVVIKGVLLFDGGNKLTMPCDSRLYVMGGGKITSDGGGNSNRIEMCATVLWTASSGQITGPSCLPTTLPGCSIVMPIELISFEASQRETKMSISWSTATESNNDYFVVQKLEGDVFVDMEKVETKALNGNSRQVLSYSIFDESPAAGANYYRLKQVDFDGSFSTSRIVVVHFASGKRNVEVFPNPSAGTFSIRMPGSFSTEINLLNSSGAVISSHIISGDQLDVTGVVPGIYYCVVKAEGHVETLKVLVQ